MTKKRLATIYAVLCTLLLAAGLLLVFFFAWQAGTRQIVACLCGIAVGFVFAPVIHELGHLAFGRLAGMECVYWKAFCFQLSLKSGKKRLSFASPFAAEQTQMRPKKGGDMKRRAGFYTLGGLTLSGIYLALLLLLAIFTRNFVAWGGLPYAAYLFFLNVLPVEYVGGKTDALVARGIRKGYDVEKCMLAAMEIQGQLAEDKAFGEIDEKYYFDLPQLAEEEPLYAIMLDLRYRYYLDEEDLDGAADCLNRLAHSQEYLPSREVERLAGELVYVHSLRGDIQSAEECGKLCRAYLAGESAAAKRILAAFSKATGKTEAVEVLKAQAKEALAYEKITGIKKLEEKLLERIKN